MYRPVGFLLTTLALVGTAVAAQPSAPLAAAEPPVVANTELTFGDAPIGAPTARSVYVYNYDPAPQLITSTAGAPTDPHFAVTDGCNGVTLQVVPTDYYCEIVYTLTPDTPGAYLATSELVVNGTPYTVHLGGKGIAPTGTISGTISLTNAAPGAQRNVYVTALDGSTNYQFHNEPNPYSVDVPPGDYCVSFGIGPWDGTFASYPGKRHCRDGITPVTVTSGVTTPNIDATMSFGSISGTIRDELAALLPNTPVRADIVGGNAEPYATSNGAGAYTIYNIVPGTYCVRGWYQGTNDPGDGPCRPGTRRVEVAAGASVTGVDIQLAAEAPTEVAPSGAISGTVTDGASTAQAGRLVIAEPLDELAWGSSDNTAADGTYTLDGLLPGQYCVSVSDDGSPLAGEAYNDKPSCATADLVTVADTTVTGIDFALSTGATISGQILSPAGTPEASAVVYVSPMDGYPELEATADASGNYTVQGLSAGAYCVRAREDFGDLPIKAYGAGGTCAQATPVAVGAGAAATGIDIQLTEGGTIEGIVTFPPGFVPGEDDGRLLISTRDLDGEQSSYVYVDLAGYYTTERLAAGLYCMDVRPPAPSLLVRRTLGSVDPEYCRAGTIEIVEGAATAVDFTMELGGSVSGWVVSPNGYPDKDPSPTLQPYEGENERVRPDGSYFVTGVPAGTYCVSMSGWGLWVVGATYDGYYQCTDGYTPVAVSAGQNTGNINFFLQAGGSVAGTITRPGGDGSNVVELHRLDAPQAVASTTSYPISATLANYSIDVPPGTYCVLVRPHSSTGNANRAYGGTPSCAGATPVVVPIMTAVEDIDITLTPQIYQPLENPARLADTRPGRPVVAGAPAGTGPVAAATVLEVQVAGLAGVPADAASVALNVTAAGATAPGHLTVFPCGQATPTASNVNYAAGQTTPNLVIAKLGTDGTNAGKVCIYTHATTDIVVDVAGFFPGSDGFVPLAAPARLTDTRPGRPVAPGAPAGTGPVAAGTVLEVQVGGLADVPGNAAAVALNVTAAGATAPGHLTVFPCGQATPTASNVNYAAGQTTPNAVIAKLGAAGPNAGRVCIYTHATTDLVVDVAGYFPDGPGLVPLGAPARLMDTRPNRPTIDGAHQAEGPIPGQTVRELQVGGRAGLPVSGASVVLNVTAAGATAAGHLTVFPCGEEVPTASNVNYVAGQTTPNAVIARLGTGGANAGKVCIRAHAATDVVVDVSGYLPAGDGPIVENQG